jgi:2-amino-4-hydroxy-6-hydroxymethyldihydropteridine diphosphokinase
MTTAYIGLGSNLGQRQEYISKALKSLAETNKIEVTQVSDIIETAPLGKANQPKYLNAVAEIKTALNAEKLHKILDKIEIALGRVQKQKWASRIIDLDLLLFGRDVVNTPNLTVPHPQMHLRSFVVNGLCQINSNLQHPVLNVPISELAARLGGSDFVLNHNQPQLVSIAGIIGVGKTTLTKKLSSTLCCKPMLEPYDKNPYLPQVYAGRKELALDSQLFFLNSRAKQLNDQTLEAGKIAISDYIFNKELIYARQLLNPKQLQLYEKAYPAVSTKIVPPVLVIYLKDSVQKCLERIRKRNRPYEQKIEPQFLENLSCGYEHLFGSWKLSPVIRISMSKLNCQRDSNIDHLANQIKFYVAENSNKE